MSFVLNRVVRRVSLTLPASKPARSKKITPSIDQFENRCLLSHMASTAHEHVIAAQAAKVAHPSVELLKIQDGHLKIETKVNSHVHDSKKTAKAMTAGHAKVTVHPATVSKAKAKKSKKSAVASSPSVPGYSPDEIRAAYDLPPLTGLSGSWSGAGQTLAIVLPYNESDVVADLAQFDSEFGLPAPPSIQVLNQAGAASPLPVSAPLAAGQTISGWEQEAALDVEMTHEIAPGANIDVVFANSTSLSDLLTAVTTAANLPGVSVVSMSFDTPESADEALLDSTFTTPAGHQGVTFVASTGDSGAVPSYPAASPNVLAVGGTSLNLNVVGTAVSYGSETSWSLGGAGLSAYEPVPSYQLGVVGSGGTRSTPDVSFDADPATGVAIYYGAGQAAGGWIEAGGTSIGAPAWAGLIAVADGMRASAGYSSLDGPSQTLPAIYSLPSSDFHQIGGSYNSSTGLGSPVAGSLVADLASYDTGTSFPQYVAQQQTVSSSQPTVKKVASHHVVKVVVHHAAKPVTHKHVRSKA